MVVFLFLVGELLEGVAAGRARASIRGLTKLVPKTALLERRRQNRGGAGREPRGRRHDPGPPGRSRSGGRRHRLGRERHRRGAGHGRERAQGARARATPCSPARSTRDGALRVRVTAAAQDNTIARVVRLVEEAQEARRRPSASSTASRATTRPACSSSAPSSPSCRRCCFGEPWGEWVYKGLAILLIGCPCALVISTPAAIAAGLSAGARRGLLMKGGAVLETLGKITTAAFDKTGTLTEGKPKVTDVVAGQRARSARCCRWPPRWRPGRAIRSRRPSSAEARGRGVPVPPAGERWRRRRQGRDRQRRRRRAVPRLAAGRRSERVALSDEQAGAGSTP